MSIALGLRLETSTATVFSEWPTGDMWNGSGPRETAHDVSFKEEFRRPPTVMVAICDLDAGNQANLRVAVSAREITRNGFTAVVRTREDTKLAQVGVSWLAIGE